MPAIDDQLRLHAGAEDARRGVAARAGDRPAAQRRVDVDVAVGDHLGAEVDGGQSPPGRRRAHRPAGPSAAAGRSRASAPAGPALLPGRRASRPSSLSTALAHQRRACCRGVPPIRHAPRRSRGSGSHRGRLRAPLRSAQRCRLRHRPAPCGARAARRPARRNRAARHPARAATGRSRPGRDRRAASVRSVPRAPLPARSGRWS